MALALELVIQRFDMHVSYIAPLDQLARDTTLVQFVPQWFQEVICSFHDNLSSLLIFQVQIIYYAYFSGHTLPVASV
jgi:hypothetical protein